MTVRDKLSALAIVGRISTSMLSERLLPQPWVTDAESVPPSAETISTEWLTTVLCVNVPGARVVDVQVAGGDDGTSARRAITVDYQHAGTPRRTTDQVVL